MELVELGELTDEAWADLIAGEREPFGAVGAGLEWRAKDRHLALRTHPGRLVAVAGVVTVTVHVERLGRLEVVGVGSVFVRRSERGRGLMSKLLPPLLRLAESIGPDRAMLFCRPELVSVYERIGFRSIRSPVRVDQPHGRVEMPMAAMWRALRVGAGWPAGRVEVQGLPF